MAFADRIAGDVGVMYYARISGIPYIFHNATALPSSWLTGGNVVLSGETYTPSGTLITDTGFTYKNSIQPKAGIGKSTGMRISFTLDSTWLDLASIHIYRSGGARYSLVPDSDIVPAGTTWTVDSTTGSNANDVIYAGLETVDVSSVDSSVQWTVSRGKYGSQQQRFAGLTDGLMETGAWGAWLLDHPGVWTGRYIQIWMATGRWDGTTFVPYGNAAESVEDKRIFVGKIRDLQIDPQLTRLHMDLQPLDRVLEEDIGFRLPTIDIGHRSQATIPIDGESDKVCMQFWTDGEPYSYELALTSSTGLASAHGVVPLGNVFADIAYTLNNALDNETLSPGWWTSGTTSISITHSVTDGKLSMTLSINSPATVSYVMYSVQMIARHGSIWRALGFTGTHTFSAQGKTLETTDIEFNAQRGLPALYISRTGTNDTTNLRLWYRTRSGAPLDMDPGYNDEDGNNPGAFIKVGEEIFKVSADTSWATYGTPWRYLTSSGRAQLGTLPIEHYIEYGEDVPDAVQCVALSGMLLPKAWLYLLEGGSGTKGHNDSTYDQGWYGSGAFLDAGYVDETSFTDIATRLGVISDNLCISEPEPLRDVVQGDAIVTGTCIVGGPDGIRLIDVAPPGQADVDAAVLALDSSNTRTIGPGGRGIKVELGEDRVVNDVMIHTLYDNGTKEHIDKVWNIAADSIGTYGRKPRLEAKLRGVRGGSSSQLAQEAAQNIIAAFKSPYAVITVDVTDPLWWTVELGDIVTLTHTQIPTISNGISLVTPGRGITTLPARVMSITHKYPKAVQHSNMPRGEAVLVVGNISDITACNISPSAYCSSILGAVCTITARYGGSEGAEFVTGDLVTLRTYDGSTRGGAEVSTATASTITLTSSPGISAPFLIEPQAYSAALQDNQRITAFGKSGNSRVLDLPSAGTAPPRVYR